MSWERDAHILATAMATETVINLEKSNTTPLDRPDLRKHLSQIVRSAAGIVALDSGGEGFEIIVGFPQATETAIGHSFIGRIVDVEKSTHSTGNPWNAN